MKQMLARLLAALLLCTVLPPCAFAAESQDASPQTEGSAVPTDFDYTDSVIFYTMPDAFGAPFDMACGDTDLTQVHNAVDLVALSGTVQHINTTYALSLPIAWDFSTVDAETPGSYTAVGSISVPVGARLAEGLADSISISIRVTAPVITLTSFDEPYWTDAVAFAAGTTQETLSDWFADAVAGFTGYDADWNYYDFVSGTWSLEMVDTATAGVYYAVASPDLGTEYTLADGVSLPQQLCAVSVQVLGQPDINCCVAGRGFLHFPWVLSAVQEEQLDAFAVWLRQDGGEWTRLSEGVLMLADGLQLSQRVLTYGSTYELRVTYPGGQTGVLSFQYDGELSILQYSGGDRDGGDVNGGDAGTGTQPAPEAPAPSDWQDDGSPSGGNDATAPDDATAEAGDTPQDADAVPQAEPPSASHEHSSASGKPWTAPTASQTPSDAPKNETDSRDNPSSAQAAATEKPAVLLPVTPAAPAVAVQVDAILSQAAARGSSAQGGDTVSRSEDSVYAARNPVVADNPIPPEKSTASQPSAAVTESYSPTQTVISGLRLKNLCQEEEHVVFGSGDVTVSIPSKLLLALDLSDTDALAVTLTQPKNNQIALAVAVSGKSVTQLSGTVVRLRYMPQAETMEITIQNDAGEQITDVSYDGALLRFAADAPGTYTIMEQYRAQQPRESTSPWLPVSGGLVLSAGGIGFFMRKYHG